MQGEQIRERLHSRQQIYGTHICGLSNALAMRIMTTAPLDFVFFCNEHMPMDRSETSVLCQLFAARGISPIVRIPYPCAGQAAMALDGGAEGIVAPYVETVEQVREVIGAVRHRPIKGKLLEQFMSGERKPTQKTKDFLKRFNRHQYTIIGMESVPAYENLDALISEPGVDGVFIGMHDLSVSFEAPEEWNHPPMWRAIEDTVRRCHAANIGVGVHIPTGFVSIEQAQKLIAIGMNWILDGSDVGLTTNAIHSRRKALMDSAPIEPRSVDAEFVASCIAPKPLQEV